MNKFLLIAFALLTSACSTTIKRPFLYLAEKDGRNITLFGTQHLGVPYDDLPDYVFTRADNADKMLVEWYQSTDPIEEKIETEKLFFRAVGEQKLKDKLSPKAYSYLLNLLAAKRFDEKYVDGLSAMGASAFLPRETAYVSRYVYNQTNPKFSIDPYFAKRRQDQNKHLDQLDEGLFSAGPSRDCMMSLYVDTIENYSNGSPGDLAAWVTDLVTEEAYRSGDEKEILRFLGKGERSSTCLLEGRNKIWMPKIIMTAKQSEDVFVMVGVGHLISKDQTDLLSLLKKEGYTIRRLQE